MEENQNQHQRLTMIIFISLSLIFVILALFLFWQKKQKSQSLSQTETKTNLSPSSTPIPQKEKGVLTLKTKDNQTIVSQNTPFTIYIYAHSDNQSITGYDVVLNYNQEIVQFIDHKNLQSDFQIFVKQNKNQLMITGVKKLTSNNPTIFADSPLIELTFQPKKTGSVTFSFDFTPQSKKDSNLINEKTEEILGKVEGVSLSISD